MDGHFHGSDRSSRQKRKRVGFADALSQLKSPCNKTARPGYFNVFLVGFSDKEKADIRRSCTDEIDVKDFVSTAVTHVVVKLPTKKNRHFPYAALYYAVVSGAWILRPSWLSHSKEGILPEGDHEFKHNQVDIQTPLLSKFTQIVSLYERYQKSRDCRGCNIFSHRVFKRVLILTGRTSEGKQKRAALQSLISAGGGSTAVDESWRVIKERPSKAATLISCIIIENGEDLGAHGININFVKQLLMKGVPVLYEEVLSQLLHNEVFPNLEIMMTHAVYYWSNEHPVKLTLSKQELDSVRKICLESENSETEHEVSSNSKFSGSPTVLNSHLTSVKNVNVDASETVEWNWYKGCDDLLDDLEREIKENQLRQKPASLSQTSVADEDKMPLVCLNHEEMVIGTTAENSENALNDCGLFEVFDFSDLQSFIAAPSFEGCSWSDVMLTRSHMIPKALARSGMECGSFPDNLRQFFEALIVEMQNNTPSSFIHDFICHEIVISLQNSLHPSLLPSPDTLSRLFHDIAKPEFGQKFDAASAVYRLLMFFLYQFPACNEEGRFYWLQVLTDGPLDGACAPSSDRRGSFLEFNNLMSRVAGFRKMVLETFTHDGSSRDLMEFIVSVLEVDLFNMEVKSLCSILPHAIIFCQDSFKMR
ncbi:hypothetical protein RB195_010890 [Necator americanus]|uniref:BRCT domain-containing protein n=1 Tax=Necator americanus TaxID=51031 RepID=A0ABR1CZY4_NECAM